MSARRTKTPIAPAGGARFEIRPLNAAIVPVISIQHAIDIVPGGLSALARALHDGVDLYECDDTLLVSLSALMMHGELQQKEVA